MHRTAVLHHALTPLFCRKPRLVILGACVGAILLSATAHADCQPGQSQDQAEPLSNNSPTDDDGEIHVDADSLETTHDGTSTLRGNVEIRQGQRTLHTRQATFDAATQTFQVDSEVDYSDPNLQVSGSAAHVDPAGGATFEGAQFSLPARNARGQAKQIDASPTGELELKGVRYTSCPVGEEDWVIRASDIKINQAQGIGVGRGVRLDFKGVPILYAPFISFPVANERKSGFLFPTLGTSSRSGASIETPWYWNIAPNYDDTFTPIYYTSRGLRLDNELRFLNPFAKGTLTSQYLPHDDAYGDRRGYVELVDKSNLTDSLRLDIEAANVSDSQWFEDFGLGPEGTSVTYLNRLAQLTYLGEHWYATARAQNFQTIDDTISPSDRPFTMLPQIAAHGDWVDQPLGLAYGLDLEVSDFEDNYSGTAFERPTGWRVDAAPEVRLPLRRGSIYLEPALSWRYTAYKLDPETTSGDRSPSRSAPIFSVDGGLAFERLTGSRQQRLQTFEPRFMYLYVPYRNQDDLPIFDTTVADLNLVQLFRTNRYVGADRLSDANQLSVGVTSRLLSASSGQQYLSATVGQAYYFHPPDVSLGGNQAAQDNGDSSDLVAELELTAYRNWSVGMGVQWNPTDARSEKGDVQVQYRPGNDRVINAGYRFRRGSIEQVDASLAWPLSARWGTYGRLVYSLQDDKSIDQFAGIEFKACCWRVRAVFRRYVSDRSGSVDTSFLFQLELNGLSSVGVADAFLQRSIHGYSLAQEDR
jgi:LPS-assembly protein